MRVLGYLLWLALGTVLSPVRAERVVFLHDADGYRVATQALPIGNPTPETDSPITRFLIDPLAPNGFAQVVAQLSEGLHPTAFLHGLAPIWEHARGIPDESEGNYLVSDGLGSTRLVIPTDIPQALTTEIRVKSTDAFGLELAPTAAGTLPPTNVLPSVSHSFRGEWFDHALSSYQLRSRWYSPASGQFSNPDSFEGYPERPHSLHKYAYAESDPVNRMDPSGHESLIGISVANTIGTSLHSMYDDAVSTTGFALMDTIRGVQAGMTADEIYRDYLINSTLSIGVGLAIGRGSAALSSFRAGRVLANEASVTRRLFALLGKGTYWERAGGIPAQVARELAGSHGFGFEVGRLSRFENARSAVVIGRQDLIGGEVNRIMLAEEIQHGLDRATSEASQAIKRGLDNVQFHAEVFARIVKNHERGYFPFLTLEDIQGLKAIIAGLK